MSNKRRSRPVGIIILAIIVFLFALWNIIRLCEAIYFREVLTKYGASPQYIAISGAFWTMASLLIFLIIVLRKPYSLVGVISFSIGYEIWYWFNKFFLEKPDANWPFVFASTILIAGSLVLLLLNSKTKSYLDKNGKDHD
jgi:hypothetical protein